MIIAVPRRSKGVNALLEKARKEDVFVQDADGTEYLLTVVDDFDREIAVQRQSQKLMAFLDERARATEWIPMEEAERRMGLPPWKGKKKKASPMGARKKKAK
jgi:hypothetical protein